MLAHLLMNASFVVQGFGMIIGALLLGSALMCCAARPGVPTQAGPGPPRARPGGRSVGVRGRPLPGC